MRFPGMSSVAAVVVLACASAAHADERKFNYSYEAKTLPKGGFEFEQWATLKMEKDAGDYNRLDLREEFEFGLTDRLTTSAYLNLRYQATRSVPGETNEHMFGFESVSSEWKYKLSDPTTDLVGFLLYGEITANNEEYEFEFKLVFSKHIGPVTIAYNFVFEWELEETNGNSVWQWANVIENTIGVALDLPFLPGSSVGVEARSEAHFERSLGGEHNSAYWIGPNVHYATGTWWATLSFLTQIKDGNGLDFSEGAYTKYELRIMFGINF